MVGRGNGALGLFENFSKATRIPGTYHLGDLCDAVRSMREQLNDSLHPELECVV